MTFDPHTEDEYFKLEDLRKLKKAREEAAEKMAAEQRGKLKDLHWMHCPKCGLELTEVPFRGVQVDACFHCGGMYFDKGEVEKILDFEEPGELGKLFRYVLGA